MTSTAADTVTLTTFTAARILVASLDLRGRSVVVQQQLRPVLVVATMLDAAAAGLLTTSFNGRRTVLRRTDETADDELLAAVVDRCEGRSVPSAINRLAISTWSGGAVDLREPLLERLADEGVLRREEGTMLSRERWHCDPETRRLVVAPFLAVLSGDVVDEVIDEEVRRLVASTAVSTQLLHRIIRAHTDPASSTNPRQVRERAMRVLETEPIAVAGHRALAAVMGAG